MLQRYAALATLVVASFWGSSAKADLIINLDFTNFNQAGGGPADGDAILGGATMAQSRAVIEQAARYWESAFSNSSSSLSWASGGRLTQNIDVTWGARSGNTLATGGTTFFPDGEWVQGSLVWDNDGSSNFFVDSTPYEHSEWNAFQQQSMNLGGVNMNVERVHYDAPAGTARDNADMFTVAVHEIGHAIGILGGSYPLIPNNDIGSDGDVDITSGTFNGAEIPYLGGHTNITVTNSNPNFPYDPGGGSSFGSFDYGPEVMNASLLNGTRKLLTETDIAFTAQILEFDMSTVNFNPAVPEPNAATLLTGILAYAVARRRKRG